MRWIPLVASGPIAFWIIYLGLHDDRPADPVQLPLAGAVLCATAAFLLEDDAARTIASLPTPLVVRRGIRVALAVPVAWALWTGLAWYANDLAGATALEFAGMLAFTMALATIGAAILGEERGGLFASPTLLVLLGASAALPPRWQPFPIRPVGTWFDIYGRWGVVLVVSVVVFLIVSTDPARRRPVRRIVNVLMGSRPRATRAVTATGR
jgi:hypothetical protein